MAVGVAVALLSIRITMKTNLVEDGLDTIFIIALVFLCFGLSTLLKGNAYLSLYLYGDSRQQQDQE